MSVKLTRTNRSLSDLPWGGTIFLTRSHRMHGMTRRLIQISWRNRENLSFMTNCLSAGGARTSLEAEPFIVSVDAILRLTGMLVMSAKTQRFCYSSTDLFRTMYFEVYILCMFSKKVDPHFWSVLKCWREGWPRNMIGRWKYSICDYNLFHNSNLS